MYSLRCGQTAITVGKTDGTAHRFQMTIYIVGQKQRASDFLALVADHTLTHEVRRMKAQRPLLSFSHRE